MLILIARLIPYPFCKIPRIVPVPIGTQLERRSCVNRYGLGSRRAITHIRRIRCCGCRWDLWLRRTQKPSWRWPRWLLWGQTDPCRLCRSWLISAIPNLASGGIGKSKFSLSVSILSSTASCLRDLLELFSAR